MSNIPHDICQMGPDAFQAVSQYAEISDIIGFIFGNVHGNVAVCHFTQYPADIIDCFSETVTDMMNCLCNHAIFILISISAGLCVAVRLNAPDNFLIAGIGGFRIQKILILMIEVCTGFHI